MSRNNRSGKLSRFYADLSKLTYDALPAGTAKRGPDALTAYMLGDEGHSQHEDVARAVREARAPKNAKPTR